MTAIVAVPIGIDKLVAKFSGYTARLRPHIVTAMQTIVFTIVAYIKDDELSGQVLKRRTGTLSRSIKGAVRDTAGEIVGNVASRDGGNAPLVYAGYHEYGFSGAQQVRAHIRKTASGGYANVRAFTRNVNYPAHPFMKPAKESHEKFINDTLTAAVTQANHDF